jgi:sortase (surface protein transpeptidase)
MPVIRSVVAGMFPFAVITMALTSCSGAPAGTSAPTTVSAATTSRTQLDAAQPVSLTSAPAAPVGAAVMTASAPVRVQIPAIGVDSGLLTLGLRDDRTMEVPPDGESAGWYSGAPTPGELGPSIIVGHVDWAGTEGVFYDLRDLEPADEVTVTRADGSTAVFRVSRVEQFRKSEFPTDAVYGDLDHAALRLITCGGSFDRQARSYVDNIVVFADLV